MLTDKSRNFRNILGAKKSAYIEASWRVMQSQLDKVPVMCGWCALQVRALLGPYPPAPRTVDAFFYNNAVARKCQYMAIAELPRRVVEPGG